MDRLVGFRETGLSFRQLSASTRHFATTVMLVWSQGVEDDYTQRRACILPRNVMRTRVASTCSYCMTVKDCTSSPIALSQMEYSKKCETV